MTDQPLAAALLAAAEWFNTALLAGLEQRGWPRLSANQSRVFPLLIDGGTSQSAVARQLGITRQSAHTLLSQLVDLALLAREDDPSDGRRTRVQLTSKGWALASDARGILHELEGELARRIGAGRVRELTAALTQDWGTPPNP